MRFEKEDKRIEIGDMSQETGDGRREKGYSTVDKRWEMRNRIQET